MIRGAVARRRWPHAVAATRGSEPPASRSSLPSGGYAFGIFGVQTMDDGAALLADLERLRPSVPARQQMVGVPQPQPAWRDEFQARRNLSAPSVTECSYRNQVEPPGARIAGRLNGSASLCSSGAERLLDWASRRHDRIDGTDEEG